MRTRVTLALAAAAALVGTMMPAANAADPQVPVSSNPDAVGNGWGHGRGMSQWGAYGRANAGIGYQDILRFYYPGTAFARQSATLRVLITADADHNLVVRAQQGLKLLDIGSKKTYTLPARPRLWRLVTVAGKTRVQARYDGTWHLYRAGGRIALVGAGQFSASTGPLSLWVDGAYKPYRGRLRFVAGRTVNVLGIEAYLRGVVPAEVPGKWPANAIRAQAVAARTYALYKKAHSTATGYDICDTSACQVYKGVAVEYPASTAAIQATASLILKYGAGPALTEFSASNGGYTAASSLPYQVAKPDPYDTAWRNWSKPIDLAALKAAYPSIGTLQWIRVDSRDVSGRVVSMTLHGTTGEGHPSGDRFRILLGLRSSMFSLQP